MKTWDECCAEVARKYRLCTKPEFAKLVTGHRATFFKEAAEMYVDQFKDKITKLEKEIDSLYEAAAGEDI